MIWANLLFSRFVDRYNFDSSRLRQSDWSAMTLICSLYKTLMSKTFPQESSEAFFNLKSALPRTKTSPACFTRVLWKALRKKDMVSFGFPKKKLFGTLPPILNKPKGFITNYWKNSSKIVLSKVLPALAAEITRFGFIGACTFFIEFSINFKRGRGQIVFSISQTTKKALPLTSLNG